jgi:hypothetical protein
LTPMSGLITFAASAALTRISNTGGYNPAAIVRLATSCFVRASCASRVANFSA